MRRRKRRIGGRGWVGGDREEEERGEGDGKEEGVC